MKKSFFTVFVTLLVVTSLAMGDSPHRGQRVPPAQTVTGDEPAVSSRGGVYPAGSVLSPGDSIGFTYYDFGTNGSANHNIINYGDGDLSIGRMAATQTATPDRGTWYGHSTNGGTTWTTMSKVEVLRRGWSNIDQFRDVFGTEVTVSHTGLEVNVHADRGVDPWTSALTGSATGALWPKLAAGSGAGSELTIHIVAAWPNPPTHLGYTRSTNAGTTFDKVDDTTFVFAASGWDADADGYDIAASGSKVAFVSAGGAEGGDVVLWTSTNAGNTWTSTVVYNVTPQPPSPGEFQPDGSCATIIDAAGTVHVVWSNYFAEGADVLYSLDAPIMYWNSANPGTIRNIAYPVQDTTIVPFVGRDGNYASQPDIAVGPNNSLYVIYQTWIGERDDSLNNYEHIYALKSLDGGATWIGPVDITPGTGFDASFGSLADWVDNNLHVVYNSDALAGNAIQGNHPEIRVAIKYLQFPTAGIVGVREVPGTVPAAYQLEQNYPNPFNPSTEIRYSLPAWSKVELTIYNLLGEKIAELVNEGQGAGSYVATWDGRNANGQTVASGVYFYKLSAGSYLSTKKMVLLK